MANTLTELITKIQAQLLDDGTLFSTATITSAVRQSLRDFNFYASVNAAEIVEVVAAQKTYELTGGAFPELVLDVLDVLKNDDDGEDDSPLDFDPIFEDNRVYIRLRTALSSGNLLIRFSQAHTISGLDSEVETTLNTDQDQIIVDGASAFSINTRLLKPIEAINLNQAATIVASYERASQRFYQAFLLGISRYAGRTKPKGETRKTSWLDSSLQYNSTSQAGSLKDL